jgi:hypothetical protein
MFHAGLLIGVFLDLKFEATDSTEASVIFQRKTRHSVSEDTTTLHAYFPQ